MKVRELLRDWRNERSNFEFNLKIYETSKKKLDSVKYVTNK